MELFIYTLAHTFFCRQFVQFHLSLSSIRIFEVYFCPFPFTVLFTNSAVAVVVGGGVVCMCRTSLLARSLSIVSEILLLNVSALRFHTFFFCSSFFIRIFKLWRHQYTQIVLQSNIIAYTCMHENHDNNNNNLCFCVWIASLPRYTPQSTFHSCMYAIRIGILYWV